MRLNLKLRNVVMVAACLAVTSGLFCQQPQINIEMVSVQGGTFTMGCTDKPNNRNKISKPAHQVTVNSFNIGKYEVTIGQWIAVMGSSPSGFTNVDDNYPVAMISCDDIVGTSGAKIVINGTTYYENGFIYKLNQLTGKQYRLPTEAEWEYAARGGDKSNNYTYSGSNNIDDVAWYTKNSGNTIHLVGTKAANELGIYDMSGNVFEWCSDWYKYGYKSKAQTNPKGPSSGATRVNRGGAFFAGEEFCSVMFHGVSNDLNDLHLTGFRLVLQ